MLHEERTHKTRQTSTLWKALVCVFYSHVPPSYLWSLLIIKTCLILPVIQTHAHDAAASLAPQGNAMQFGMVSGQHSALAHELTPQLCRSFHFSISSPCFFSRKTSCHDQHSCCNISCVHPHGASPRFTSKHKSRATLNTVRSAAEKCPLAQGKSSVSSQKQ